MARKRPIDLVGRHEAATFVYVVECEGRTKIGIATDAEKRVRAIQNGAGATATLIHSRLFSSRLSAAQVEASLHKQFSGARLKGEWFDVDASNAADALRAADDPNLHTLAWHPDMPADVLHSGSLARWQWYRAQDKVHPSP